MKTLLAALWFSGTLCTAEMVTQLDSDESAILFPAMGWRDATGDGWTIEFHAWVFEQESRRLSVAAVQGLLGFKLEDLNPEEESLLQQRAKWFLVDNERNKNLIVSFNQQRSDLGTTESNGHVTKRIVISGDDSKGPKWHEGVHQASLAMPAKDPRIIACAVHLIDEEGWSVISDIDDTIKVTEVRNKEALLRNTFCRPFQPADGMAKWYAEWSKQGAVFHYVSASPWPLFTDLEAFRAHHGYPAGTFHLRPLRLKDPSGIQFLTGIGDFKTNTISELITRFPKRKFILIGDSGERDPEIYGELLRKHSAQVMRVLIRNVTEEAADAQRFLTAFDGIAKEQWALFQHPSEITPAILRLPDAAPKR